MSSRVVALAVIVAASLVLLAGCQKKSKQTVVDLEVMWIVQPSKAPDRLTDFAKISKPRNLPVACNDIDVYFHASVATLKSASDDSYLEIGPSREALMKSNATLAGRYLGFKSNLARIAADYEVAVSKVDLKERMKHFVPAADYDQVSAAIDARYPEYLIAIINSRAVKLSRQKDGDVDVRRRLLTKTASLKPVVPPVFVSAANSSELDDVLCKLLAEQRPGVKPDQKVKSGTKPAKTKYSLPVVLVLDYEGWVDSDPAPPLTCGPGESAVGTACKKNTEENGAAITSPVATQPPAPSAAPAPVRCDVGQVRRGGRCVPKPPRCGTGQVLLSDGRCVTQQPEVPVRPPVADNTCDAAVRSLERTLGDRPHLTAASLAKRTDCTQTDLARLTNLCERSFKASVRTWYADFTCDYTTSPR